MVWWSDHSPLFPHLSSSQPIVVNNEHFVNCGAPSSWKSLSLLFADQSFQGFQSFQLSCSPTLWPSQRLLPALVYIVISVVFQLTCWLAVRSFDHFSVCCLHLSIQLEYYHITYFVLYNACCIFVSPILHPLCPVSFLFYSFTWLAFSRRVVMSQVLLEVSSLLKESFSLPVFGWKVFLPVGECLLAAVS